MGFKYRKSINLGGGFRINVSKSGVGYSWGTKGFRITKTAKGTTRKTYSIPGTGVSYVSEKRNKTYSNDIQRPPIQGNPNINNNSDEFTGIAAAFLAVVTSIIVLIANALQLKYIFIICLSLSGIFWLFAIIRGIMWIRNKLRKRNSVNKTVQVLNIPLDNTDMLKCSTTGNVDKNIGQEPVATTNLNSPIRYIVSHYYYTKVVGVTFNGIQSILPQLHGGMPVQFIREPNNPFDHNAIGIWCNGKKIGNLSADEATTIAPQMDRGVPYDGEISQITGGNGKTYGCEISVNVYKPSISGLTSQVEHIDESNPMFKKTCVLFGYDNFAAYNAAQCIANLGGFTRQRISGKMDFAIVNKGQPEYELEYTLAKVERYRTEGKKVEIMYSDKLEEIKKAYLNL